MSTALFDMFRAGAAIMVVSDIVQNELQDAPSAVRDILLSVPSRHRRMVAFSPGAANDLAETYISEGVIPRKCLEDAQHIALASVNRVDALVSWNFKHIVHPKRISGYNAVNSRLGHPILDILTPTQEVQRYEHRCR